MSELLAVLAGTFVMATIAVTGGSSLITAGSFARQRRGAASSDQPFAARRRSAR